MCECVFGAPVDVGVVYLHYGFKITFIVFNRNSVGSDMFAQPPPDDLSRRRAGSPSRSFEIAIGQWLASVSKQSSEFTAADWVD